MTKKIEINLQNKHKKSDGIAGKFDKKQKKDSNHNDYIVYDNYYSMRNIFG